VTSNATARSSLGDVWEVGVGAAETDVRDVRRRAGTVDAVHRVFDDFLGAEDGVGAAGAADLAHQHQAGRQGVVHAAHDDRAPVPPTLVDHRAAVQRGGIVEWGVAMVTIPGVGPVGLNLASRLAVPEPPAGGIRRSTTPTGPLDVIPCRRSRCCRCWGRGKAGEFVAGVGAGGEGADVAVGAECGVDRAVPGAAHDGVRPQVTRGVELGSIVRLLPGKAPRGPPAPMLGLAYTRV